MMVIYNHFNSIGADNQLLVMDDSDPNRKSKNHITFHKWFQTLVVNNNRFPYDLPVNFVLKKFFDAILQPSSGVEIKGYNLLTHIQAFGTFLDSNRQSLREQYLRTVPHDQRPKELQSDNERSEEDQKNEDRKRISELLAIYGDDIPEPIANLIKTLEKPYE